MVGFTAINTNTKTSSLKHENTHNYNPTKKSP